MAQQRAIQKEVKARYKSLVGPQVGGKANDDEVEEAHVLVERHRQRCVALSEEYNKLRQRAEQKDERAGELRLLVGMEASAGGLRAPMTDEELGLIQEDRRRAGMASPIGGLPSINGQGRNNPSLFQLALISLSRFVPAPLKVSLPGA